jgi:hypothetical protein
MTGTRTASGAAWDEDSLGKWDLGTQEWHAQEWRMPACTRPITHHTPIASYKVNHVYIPIVVAERVAPPCA